MPPPASTIAIHELLCVWGVTNIFPRYEKPNVGLTGKPAVSTVPSILVIAVHLSDGCQHFRHAAGKPAVSTGCVTTNRQVAATRGMAYMEVPARHGMASWRYQCGMAWHTWRYRHSTAWHGIHGRTAYMEVPAQHHMAYMEVPVRDGMAYMEVPARDGMAYMEVPARDGMAWHTWRYRRAHAGSATLPRVWQRDEMCVGMVYACA